MTTEYKRVPAVDKCFAILELFAGSEHPLGISDISNRLGLNKSTVFHMVHTLADLRVLQNVTDGKFKLGTRLYTLGHAAGKSSELIQTVHPYLEKINRETKLSAFLGIRSNDRVVILDKVDTAYDIKISSEVGMRLPLLAGATGKALLSQLPDQEINKILSEKKLKKFTPKSRVGRGGYLKDILQTRKQGIAFDMEEYIEGIIAFALPIKTGLKDLEAAVWAVGLRKQIKGHLKSDISAFLIRTAKEINDRFVMTEDLV